MTDFSADKLRALDEAATHGAYKMGNGRDFSGYLIAEDGSAVAEFFGADGKFPELDLACQLLNNRAAILAMAEERERLEGDVQLWKRIANERSEQMQQLNLDRAAMGVENMQLREALQSCSECDPESAMFAAAALDQRSDLPAQSIAIEAGKLVLEGRGTGLYSEAEDAIRLLIAAFPETKP